jgi:hypothetical protein
MTLLTRPLWLCFPIYFPVDSGLENLRDSLEKISGML